MVNLYSFAGEMLVLFLIFVLNLRVFFTSRTRRDVLVLFGPFSFLLSIVQIFAWGLTTVNTVILCLSLLAMLINYRSFLNYNNHVVVDGYKLPLIISSIILLIITIALITAEIIFRPVMIPQAKYNVKTENKFLYYENGNFPQEKKFNTLNNISISLYFSENSDKDTIVILLPDLRAEKSSYIPYCTLLARTGYTVLTGDYYPVVNNIWESKLFRRTNLCLKTFKKEEVPFASDIKVSAYYKELYTALIAFAAERFPDKKFFFVTDDLSVKSKTELTEIFRINHTPLKKNSGILNLKNIPEYKTPGFGFIEQTNPLFASYRFGLKRDKTMFEPSYCVFLTTETLNKLEGKSGENK